MHKIITAALCRMYIKKRCPDQSRSISLYFTYFLFNDVSRVTYTQLSSLLLKEISKRPTLFFIELTSTEDDMSVFKMVRDGMGLAVTSRLIAEENTDGVRILTLTPPLRRDLCYITSKSSRRSFALREFIAHLKACCGELS